MTRSVFARITAAVGLAAVLSTAVAQATPVDPSERKDRTEPLPKRLEGVDVVEHLNVELPKATEFRDETGKPVKLGDYFDGKVPVIVTLNYSNCPMLCSLVLNALATGLKDVKWTAGKEFRIVTISIDPNEKPETAARTKERYASFYGRLEARDGWHVLTGSEASIHAVADAVGFRYGYNEKRKEYVHPAAIAIATPDGRIGRYLYGIQYAPKTLSLSLVEVSEGKIGSSVDRLILYCFHYDSSEGRYAPVAVNVMRLGGGLTAISLFSFVGLMWLGELRKRRKAAESSTSVLSDPQERTAT